MDGHLTVNLFMCTNELSKRLRVISYRTSAHNAFRRLGEIVFPILLLALKYPISFLSLYNFQERFDI